MAAWSATRDWNTPRLSRRLVSLAKNPSTALSQDAEVGVKWNVQRGWRSSHAHNLWMLVGGVVVHDGMDQLACGHLGLDGIEEADELLVPMALHAAADHAALQHIEGGKQRGGAVPDVVVRHGAATPLLQRQPGLGAIERLDLALFVHRKHDGMSGRIDVKADDIAQLGGELRVVGQLELAHPVRLQAVRAPDALHRADADADAPWPSRPRSNASSRPAARLIVSGHDALADLRRASGGMRDGRVLSRSRPSTPPCMNRSCQRQTAVLACRHVA